MQSDEWKYLIWTLWKKCLVLFNLATVYSFVTTFFILGHYLEYDSLLILRVFPHPWMNSQWWIGCTDPLIYLDMMRSLGRIDNFSYDRFDFVWKLNYISSSTRTTLFMRTYIRGMKSYNCLIVLLEVLLAQVYCQLCGYLILSFLGKISLILP